MSDDAASSPTLGGDGPAWTTTSTPRIDDTVATCRRLWRTQGIPRALRRQLAEETQAELEAHCADGGHVEDIVGDDPARYAAARSRDRGRPDVASLALRWLATPFVAFGLAALVQQTLIGEPGMRPSSLVILLAILGALLIMQTARHQRHRMNRATSAGITGLAVLGAGIGGGMAGTLDEADPLTVPMELIVLALLIGGTLAGIESVRNRRQARALVDDADTDAPSG